MASIYLTSLPCENLLRCDDLSQTNQQYTRNPDYILNKLAEITPHNIKPINHHIVKSSGGIIVNYNSDTDINFIYAPENLLKLNSANIKPQLSHITKEQREIYISEVPTSIYNKPKEELTTELESTYNINILHLKPFHLPNKDKTNYLRYLVITLDSYENRNKFTAANKTIKLSNIVLPCANKRSGKKRPTQLQPLVTPQAQSYITKSAQHQGNALTNRSLWGGPRNNPSVGSLQQNISSGYTTLRPRHQPSYRPTQDHSFPALQSGYSPNSQDNPTVSNSAPPQSGSQIKQQHTPQHSDSKYKNLIEATNIACKTLSLGLPHPDIYVNILNKTLDHIGHPMVTIPNSALDISRQLYLKNSINDNISVLRPVLNSSPPLPHPLPSFNSSSLPPQNFITSHPSKPAQPVNSIHPSDPAPSQVPHHLTQPSIQSQPVSFLPTLPSIPPLPFIPYPPHSTAISQLNPSYPHAPYHYPMQILSAPTPTNIL